MADSNHSTPAWAPDGTRRAILASALAAAAPALTGLATENPQDRRWSEISAFCAFCGPDGALAVRRARLSGMDPDDFSGVALMGRGFERKTTALTFGDWSAGAAWFRVTADAVTRVQP
jgi:hypothetical protein